MKGYAKTGYGVAAAILVIAVLWSFGRTSPAPRSPAIRVVPARAIVPSPSVASASPQPQPGRTADAVDPHKAELERVAQDITPLLQNAPSEFRANHERLLREVRDEPWATRSEAELRSRYEKLNGIGNAGRKIDVLCGSTICEISGGLEDLPGASGAEVMSAVQDLELVEQMAARGFRTGGGAFGRGRQDREMFIVYCQRARPEIIKLRL